MADGYGFAFEDPLTPGELAEVEAQLGTELPADYCGFLLEVSAGGAGLNFYGLYPVRRVDDTWRWVGDGADLADLTLVAQPFPGPIGAEVIAELYAEMPDEESFENQDDFFAV